MFQGFLYVSGATLTDVFFLLLTDGELRMTEHRLWMTEHGLQIDNALRAQGHGLDQLVPMCCHFQGTLSI